MTDGWAVLLGAVIALVGSVVAPWIREALAAKRRRAEIERKDSRARKRELGVTIRELLDSLLELHVKGGSNKGEAFAARLKRVMMAALDFGLLLEQSDQAIVSIVSDANVAIMNSEDTAVSALTSLTSVLPAWRRGTITAWEALTRYRAATGRPVEIEDEDQFRATT
jgi:hypothetical protein